MNCPVCTKPVKDGVTKGKWTYHPVCHEAGNRISEVKEWDDDNPLGTLCGYCKKPYVRGEDVLWHILGGTLDIQHLKCYTRAHEPFTH